MGKTVICCKTQKLAEDIDNNGVQVIVSLIAMPIVAQLVTVAGERKRLVPPTTAPLQSPFARAMHASSKAIIDEEQVVRMVKLLISSQRRVEQYFQLDGLYQGPYKSSSWEMRSETIKSCEPIIW